MEDKTSAHSANKDKITLIRLLGAVAHMRAAQRRYESNNRNGEFLDVKTWYEGEVDRMLEEQGY